MSATPRQPLSRPIEVGRLPRGRAEVSVEATDTSITFDLSAFKPAASAHRTCLAQPG